jgi:membrane protease YdiL (CAAX protease family)
VITAMIAGRAGARDLFRRFLIWRVGLTWHLIAFFMMAMLILARIGLHLLFGGAMPVIPAAGVSIFNIVLAFVILIVAGALINTEEIAWRGLALPRLQARYSPLTASLLLALPEGAFHLPYFWNKDSGCYQNARAFWFTAFTLAAVS